jgi:lysophospholipase L1-like esterase
MIYGIVVCLGDSLITGARDEAGLSVARILGDCLSVNDQKWIAVDEGVNGETSGSLLRRAYRVVRSYPEAKDVVLCIGINDAKVPATSEDVFRRNYAELLRTFAILGKHCYACLIPPRNGFGAPDYIDNHVLMDYNRVIEELAKSASPFVSIVDLTSIPARLRADGVHFNFGGDAWAAKKIAATIMSARS